MESTTLHTMARRYLMSRNEKLRAAGDELPNDGRRFFGYTQEAQRIYPRYNAVTAILREVERLDPDDLPPPDRLASALATASATRSVFRLTRVEAEADAEERALFRAAVRSWRAAEDLLVEPLPYRRLFSEEEHERWRDALARRWGLAGFLWHPLIAVDVPDDVLVVDASALEDGPGTGLVRAALAGLGLSRVVEVREPGDPGGRVDLATLEPSYTGAEGIWTDDTLDWILYASHENSVAFGGTLAERLRTSWPDLADWGWAPIWDQPAK
ncbi:hypothetical protein [Lentzea sp. NBRC 102530]|uniref:hypothetical protein n=1 Tax=Lentzea sp. NBRC 102530 TaxID=3032201 RepID=UPI0024A4772A|nr:hypothetical protein [Lentzea sp. NBRC 102530]GLY54536.1 hypothetical protein Lesp01_81910 [Lentzea sp. NBRC 102530]